MRFFINVSKYLLNKKFSGIFSLILILISQISCAPSKDNKRIVIASAGKIESIDPAQANTLRSLQLISSLGDPLYRINSNGLLEPSLAKSLPEISNKGLTITIPLREDVFFHDGTKFNSHAMAFSLKRFIRIGTQNYVIAGRVKKIETPSEYLIRIKLNKPSSSINGLLTSINLTPISPKSYAEYKDKFLNKRFVGTGPYKLISFQPEKQRIEPFSNYWGKKPNNKGIDYINFRNSSSLFGAIRNKEADVLLSNSIEDIQSIALNRMARKGVLQESTGPAMEIGYLTLKSNSHPFNQEIIRKGISYSINRKLLTKKVSFGLREPLRSIVPPIFKKNKYSHWPNYNPQVARQYFREAGYCENKKLLVPLTFRSNVPADKLLALTWQEQVKRDLADCLNIQINGVESTTVYKQLSDGAYPAVILDWTGAYADPEAYLFPLLSCDEIKNKTCEKGESVFSGSFWASKTLQEALEKSEKLQGSQRLEKLNEVEKFASKGNAYIPIWIVKPRAWANLNVNTPEFDGSGRVLLDRLMKHKK